MKEDADETSAKVKAKADRAKAAAHHEMKEAKEKASKAKPEVSASTEVKAHGKVKAGDKQ
jgi:hypothetical protein